jgi:hypothetical protein
MSEHDTECVVLTYVASHSRRVLALSERPWCDVTWRGRVRTVVAVVADWSVAAVAPDYAMQQMTRAREATSSM